MSQKTKVIFFQIKNSIEKLIKITKTASVHFEDKKKLFFLTSDEKSSKYVDDLLWKEPMFSLLPHVISDIPTNDFLVITQKKENLNETKAVFNLTSTPFFEFPCSVIYEFDDVTDKKKHTISKSKFTAYREKGYLIESR
jgi:DNA polymerase IIIc chi subunit